MSGGRKVSIWSTCCEMSFGLGVVNIDVMIIRWGLQNDKWVFIKIGGIVWSS